MSEEIVIKNGRILTMDETRCAEWVQVSGGKIRRLGTGQTYKEGLSESARIIDARGRTILPGFIDSHFHMIITALGADWVNLEGSKNFRSVGKKLKAAQAKNPGKLIIAAKLD